MPAAANDDDIVLRLRLWLAPLPWPVLVTAESVAGKREQRMAGHEGYKIICVQRKCAMTLSVSPALTSASQTWVVRP